MDLRSTLSAVADYVPGDVENVLAAASAYLPDDLEKAARAPRGGPIWVPSWARRSSLQTAVSRFRTPLSWRCR